MEGSSERTKRAIDAVVGTHTDAGENVDEDVEGDGDPDVAAERPYDSQVDDVTEDGEDPE